MIFNVIREIFDLPPNNRIFQKDIKLIAQGLRSDPTELIPWSDEETELLSLNEQKIKLKGLKYKGAGIIKTIFHESLVKFGYKKYRRKEDYGLSVVITSDREYVYIKLPTLTKVYINDLALGAINSQAGFYTSNKKKVSAKVDRTNGPYNTIFFGQTAVGQVVNPDSEQSNNPRAIIPLVDLEGKDLDIFLALCFYQWLDKIKNF